MVSGHPPTLSRHSEGIGNDPSGPPQHGLPARPVPRPERGGHPEPLALEDHHGGAHPPPARPSIATGVDGSWFRPRSTGCERKRNGHASVLRLCGGRVDHSGHPANDQRVHYRHPRTAGPTERYDRSPSATSERRARARSQRGQRWKPTRISSTSSDRLPYTTFDADNHLYENRDALTKFLPPEYEGVIKYVEVNGRTKLAIRDKISDYIPNPTFGKVAVPGGYGRTSPRVTARPSAGRLPQRGLARCGPCPASTPSSIPSRASR